MTASLNPYISKFDKELDVEKSSQYRLTIQFSLGGLSFALLDAKPQSLVALEYYQSDLLSDSDDLFRTLERALEAKKLNNKAFSSVTCIIDERINSLIPAPLFDDREAGRYLDFGFQVPEHYTVMSEQLETVDAYNVFAWPKALYDKVMAKWGKARITHSSRVFVDSVMGNTDNASIFVNVRNRDFDMVIQKNGKLTFFNNFKFNTKDDFAYFLVFAMEQNELSGDDTPVYFTGLILPASDIIDLCGRYVRNIRFMMDPHKLQVCKALDEVPFQYYYIHYQELMRAESERETRDYWSHAPQTRISQP